MLRRRLLHSQQLLRRSLALRRLVSLNICHSGRSEWGAISAEHVPRLRHIVKSLHHVDIYDNKVAWFPTIEFCEEHEIPAMFGVQCGGDVVVLDGIVPQFALSVTAWRGAFCCY